MNRSMTAAPGPAAFAVEAQVPGRYLAASADDLIVIYWTGDADVAGARFLHQLCEKQTHARTRIASAVHLVDPSVSLPTAEVRSQLMASMQFFEKVTCCLGIVLLGTGFWASAMRSALTGIRMVAPVGASQMRFGHEPNEIVTWLASAHEEGTGKPLRAANPHAVVEQVCSLVATAW